MSLRIIQPLIGLAAATNATDSTPMWVNGTNYSIGTLVQLRTTGYVPDRIGVDPGGIYQCLVAGVSSVSPHLDSVRWGFVSVPNGYQMYDSINESQTIFPVQINTTIVVAQIINTLALFNLDAVSVTVNLTDYSTGTVLMNTTFPLQSPPTVANWYGYFFDPFVNKTELVVSLPTCRTSILNVQINQANSGDAKCGTMIVGYACEIASGIQYGAELGITDYSRKEKDSTFGTYKFIQRAYSKRAEFAFYIENASVDAVISYLAGLRAIPTLYIGDDGFTSTAIYGFYKDFNITISYATQSVCTLSLEGLN